MEKILPNLIHNDQAGFIHQRQTQDNTRHTLHIMNHIQQHTEQAVIISLDAEKAFDSVCWQYLYRVLHKFGFDELIINNIRALYDNPSATLRINGHLTQSLTLERGMRQGCAWSPLLFAIFQEPFAQHIRQNRKIVGITINDVEHKIACYADDILLFLKTPEEALPEAMNCLKNMGPMTGYKLNLNKTEALLYNYSPSEKLKQTYPLKWTTDSIKYLGVTLTKDISRLFDKNYNHLYQRVKEDLTKWNHIPCLSISSRIETIKINVLPRFLYLFQTLPLQINQKDFTEWDKTISRFIWQGRRPRIRYKTLQLPKVKGGWGLPCLKKYYTSAMIRAVLHWCDPSYKAAWKEIESKTISNMHIQAVLADKNLQNYISKIRNPVVKATLGVWKTVVKENKLEKDIKILKWCAYDSEFTPNQMDPSFKNWIDKGITSMCGIVKKDEIMSFQTPKAKVPFRKPRPL